jgi:acyl-[acyl-carrier-protein]-phospholipid O-acyltransferase/long-chain-fatty-acid--[acyl-carrier-protein] ligase
MSDTSPSRLSAGFVRLNISQFCGALNDNVFKVLAILFLIHLHGVASAASMASMAAVVFIVPFLLFSAAAGVLADRLSKRNILVFCKVLEVGAMAGAALSFHLRYEPGLYLVLFLIGSHSALFSPSKYGIVPELVGRDQLSRANSLLVMATFLAVVLGSAVAPFLVGCSGSNYTLAQSVCVVTALVGLVFAVTIPRTPPAGSVQRISPLFVRDIWRTLWSIRGDRYLLQAVAASAYFTMLGAYMQLNMIPYGIQHLGWNEQQSGYLFFVASIGIAAGALVSGKLSGRNIEFGIVPLGALILAAGSAALRFLPPTVWAVGPAVFLAGAGAGLFIVPVDSFVQSQAPVKQRGEILAASSFLSWVGALLASGLVMLTVKLGWSAATGFLFLGGLTAALLVFTLRVLPDFLLRFGLLVVMRLAYRIRVLGGNNVPIDGAAVLVCNHVSHLDALLLVATQQRRLRFIVEASLYDRWPRLRWAFDLMGCLPVDPKGSPKQLAQALKAARAALDDGYMVCVFAEGTLTRTGNLREFRRGFAYLVRETNYPIIPVYIGGAWGAITSYYHGQLVRRWAALLRYPVTVLFGAPLPASSTVNDVRLAVMELSCDYYQDRKALRRPLGELFAKSAHANWDQVAMTDANGKRLTYGKLLTGTLALAARLRSLTAGQDKVGILLPSSVGGALTNLAVTFLGKTSVNLNFTASAESLQSAIRQCDLKTIVTAREFLEKIGMKEAPAGTVYVEEVLASLTAGEKRKAYLRSILLPARALARLPGFQADRVATIIFSSGSTGEPKGVMLSHHNILSNIESLRHVFQSSPTDNVCAALPFFHSLGFTATIWFPLLSGFSATYHANPLDGGTIARLVRENHSTMLFATPTFLLLYLRKATKDDFASLKYVVVGAEKLKERMASAFEERFGLRPLEGYGATELSPVATLSLPHVSAGGVSQKGWKAGCVGLPLPGVAVKVVDPETGRVLPFGEAGLLMVKGANVMLGYLGKPDLTAEVLRDGWYCTGDVACLDAEGFVAITDRLSRFSKIGGEMVPHLAIEEELHRRLGSSGQVLAIASVPDERKGEKLVLLYTDEAGDAVRVAQAVESADLPNLWKPGREACHRIEALPVLGTGKIDLRSLKEMARRLSGEA